MVNNCTLAPDLDPVFLTYYLGSFSVVALVNVVGNCLVLRTIYRHQSLWLPTNVFICSLAVSDLIFGFVYPFYNVSGLNIADVRAVFGTWTVCRILLMEAVALEQCSAYALVAITITRYIYVANPLSSHKYVTMHRNVITVVILWVTSHVVAGLLYAIQVPAEVEAGEYCGVCRFELVYTERELSTLTILQFAVPFSFMAVFYLRMTCIASKLKRTSVSEAVRTNDIWSFQTRDHRQRRRKSMMVTLLIGCFFLSYVPIITFCFLTMLHVYLSEAYWKYLGATSRIFLFTNTAINIFVYAGRMDDFRFYLRKDLVRLNPNCCKTSQHTSHVTDVMVISSAHP